MERRKLDDAEISSELAKAEGWEVRDGKVAKSFTFNSYASGVVFASGVAHLADRMDHHPDILIGYQRVDVAVNTHDVGGISPWDFELARRIDALG